MNVLQIKSAVRQRDGFRCTLCGMSQADHFARYGHDLDVHRVTPGSPYAVDSSCITVCRSCHGPLPKSEPGTGEDLRLVFHLPDELREAVEQFAQHTHCNKSEVMRTALADFLARNGFWPWPLARA